MESPTFHLTTMIDLMSNKLGSSGDCKERIERAMKDNEAVKGRGK